MRSHSEKSAGPFELEDAIYNVAERPFSRQGHLWVICHLGGFLQAVKLKDKPEEAARRAVITATKGFLDQAYQKQTGIVFLNVIKDLKSALKATGAVYLAVDLLHNVGQKVEKSLSEDAKPITRSRLKKVLAAVVGERDAKPVSSWLNHATRAYQDALQLVADSKQGKIDEVILETATSALSPSRYMIPWLLEWRLRSLDPNRTNSGKRENNTPTRRGSSSALAASIIAQHVESTDFSLDELLAIHGAFSSAVRNLPAVDVNVAAKLIGVTVDRVHRMAALHEIDTFYIRRRIPKGEVRLKRKEAAKSQVTAASPLSPEIREAIIKSLAGTNFSILELIEIQEALENRITQISYPLKKAVEHLGYTEVHVHALVRKGKLRTFGLPRLIPESEALRLQRDPKRPHMGRPRISERKND